MKSNKSFGEDYLKMVSSLLYNGAPPKSSRSKKALPLRDSIGKELELLDFSNHSIKNLLEQSTKAKKLDLADVARLDQYGIPVLEVDSKAYSEILGSSRASAYTGKIPFILSRRGRLKESDLLHESAHVVHGLLDRQGHLPVHEALSPIDGADFKMFRNELLSKLVEGAKPFAYTHNVLNKTLANESREVKNWRIKINDALGDEFLKQGIKSFDHAGRIAPTFFAQDFDSLYSNLFE